MLATDDTPPAAVRRKARSKPQWHPRADQNRLAAEIVNILASSGHAYLEAPTGSGKTLTMAVIGNEWPGAVKVYLAHSVDIVDQTARQLNAFAAAGLISNRSTWRCATWQSYREAVRRGRLQELVGTASPDLVFVDECHIGGGEGPDSNLSFQAIRATAQKVVWISATPWDVNEQVLGVREGCSAVLRMQEAFNLELLNATDIVRIDCGLRLRAAVAQLEKQSGTTFSTLARQSFEVNQDCAELAFDDLAAQVEQLLDRSLRPTDVSTIVRHRIRLLADVYLQRHMSERAMFWLPNQAYARECAQYISDRLPLGHRAEAIIHDPGNRVAEMKFGIAAREEFAREDGLVRVACVVFRLREGFDSPGLHLGFDCSWSPRNLRATVQKIGRLTRRAPGKPRSQYYYAVDVKTVAGARASQLSEAFLGGVQAALRADIPSAQFTAEAIIEAGAIADAMSGSPDARPRSFWSHGAWSGDDITGTHVPLFEFEQVAGYAEVSRATLDAAFVKPDEVLDEHVVVELAVRLLEALEQGQRAEEFPPAVVNALRRCCTKIDPLHDLMVHRRLNRATPALAARWGCVLPDSTLDRMDRDDAIVAAIEAGKPRPSQRTFEGQQFSRALIATGPYFRPDLAARLAALGQYEPQQGRRLRLKRETDLNIERIVGSIERGEEPPAQGTADRNRLSGWLSPFGSKTRPDVRERIERVRRDLIPKGISYAERDTARRQRQLEMITWVAQHRALPPASSDLGKILKSWLQRNPSFLAEFLKELKNAAGPAKIDVKPKPRANRRRKAGKPLARSRKRSAISPVARDSADMP
ncbi:DEAD/DEAH box helicase [Novosphingobium cyanobacteriorum]|uniref:DEAD/DEAH box helicase family protein n=1 Tax=Novosphingobium cyanobacteriorum TaxID=3024215 RepID=A0ABT6CR01_9SPHN|nr:DEAD/DEAH box helicase family protein [Novosphingobium cyanobacteriorum]MDF8335793.1 DEAD/DEAH box helicase family protein [Novosphingobium cyanobacteriorum]